MVAPHPFFPAGSALRGYMNRYADLFDAVEYNAMFTSVVNFNILGEHWARRHGKPMIGNGDVHRLEMLGTTYSLIDAQPNADAICAAIAGGRVQVVAQPLSPFTAGRLMADLAGLRKSAPRGRLPSLALKRDRPQGLNDSLIGL